MSTDDPVTRQQADAANVHRHLFARQFCRGREVLNVPGEQDFGNVILSQAAARFVSVGADAVSDEPALFENLGGSPDNLPVPDASVDVVVCLDGTASSPGYEKFLYEVRRVLRRGGIFVVSTPDRETSSADTDLSGAFSRVDFLNLLSRFFSRTNLGLQKMSSVSVALPYRPAAFAPEIFQEGDAQTFEAADALKGASHVIAIASNEPLPAIRWGVLVDDRMLETLKDQVARCDVSRVERLETELENANNAAAQLRHDIEDRDRRLQESASGIEDRDRRLAEAASGFVQLTAAIEDRDRRLLEADAGMHRLTSDLADRGQQLAQVEHESQSRGHELQHARQRLHAIETSTSWRAMRLVQRVARKLRLVRRPER